MNEVLHANIFFLIASIATIIFFITVTIAMYYVIRILASIRAIVERVEAGSDVIAEDISAMREFVYTKGSVGKIFSFLTHFGTTTPKSARKTRKPEPEE
jgi:hypothetical protein